MENNKYYINKKLEELKIIVFSKEENRFNV